MKKASPEELIRSKGLKVTQGRVAVLAYLIEVHEPVSAQDVREHMRDAIDFVTVYRILDQFVKAGIIEQTYFRNGVAYFEFQTSHHHHVVCRECGFTEHVHACVSPELFSQLQKESKKFSAVTHHVLEFFGICKQCSGK